GSKKPGLSAASLKKIFWSVGIGAIKYNYLSQNRQTDIVFDWDKMLSLEGNSSPYIQYSFARLSSILKKSGQKSAKLELKDIEFLSEGEINLLRKLVQFPEVVFEAAFDYLPNLVANYVFELASQANSFYEKYPVLQAKENEKKSRLKLIALAAATIKNSLSLFGIESFERI
ncbi:MAG: Arginine-tRNA ligase, partial [Parcubacteria group bacterium GW2011_GWA1_Parcubacteria_45_10]